MTKTKVVQQWENEKYNIFLIKETEKDYEKYITKDTKNISYEVHEFCCIGEAQYFLETIIRKI